MQTLRIMAIVLKQRIQVIIQHTIRHIILQVQTLRIMEAYHYGGHSSIKQRIQIQVI